MTGTPRAAAELAFTVGRGIDLVRGEGATVWDESGRSYVDCVGGHGAAVLGHSHPALVEAVRAQVERLVSCPVSFGNDRRREVLERLVGEAPEGLDRAFFCNSGTEAVEAALKLARAEHVGFASVDALDAAIGPDTAAVILEPVQGEGGVHPAPEGYLEAARRLCDARGALLVLDEVQTGFGRTGRLFALEHFGVTPDILCLAKGIAGGVPMGAVLAGERVVARPGHHGSTFGGNPLSCAAAAAVLDVMRRDSLPARADRLGGSFRAALLGLVHPRVREVRGLGLMVGVELDVAAGPVVRDLQERGVLALTAGRKVVRFLPPLVVEAAQLGFVVSKFEAALDAVVDAVSAGE
jgi:acetylornithine/LysW-gamma-L-lysine aminotransferase